MDSQAPADALMATGLRGALLRVEMATASTPRKKAVRRIAPRLPGSSCEVLLVEFGAGNGLWESEMRSSGGEGYNKLTIPSRKRMRGYRENPVLYLMFESVPLITSSSRD